MCDRLELWTKIVYILFVKVIIPLAVTPMVVISYTLYFTTDMGPDAFIVLNATK